MKFLIVFVAVVAAAAGLPTGISEASAPLVQLIVNVNAGQQAPVIPETVVDPIETVDPVAVVDEADNTINEPIIIPPPVVIPPPVLPEPILPGPVFPDPDVNPIDIITSPEHSPIDVIAVGEPEINPVDLINPVPVVLPAVDGNGIIV